MKEGPGMRKVVPLLIVASLVAAAVILKLSFRNKRRTRGKHIETLYTVEGLDSAGRFGRPARPASINDEGFVAGARIDTGKGFIWSPAGTEFLGSLPGIYFSPTQINNKGEIVGDYELKKRSRAFYWRSGKMTDLGNQWRSASGINDSGQIVGYDKDDDNALLWVSGKTTNIGKEMGWQRSHFSDINNKGQIVGSYHNGTVAHAVLYSAGSYIDLGDLPGGDDFSSAYAINDLGQVVGKSDVAGGSHAFLWEDGKLTDLGVLPGKGCMNLSKAHDINNSGQVIGYSYFDDGSHPFIWDKTNGMRNLNDLIDPDSGWGLGAVYSINNKGQIAGVGWGPRGPQGFVLNPLPKNENPGTTESGDANNK